MLETPAKQKAGLFETDTASALQAISQAQAIAFAPYVFQASVLLRDRGLLKLIEGSRKAGMTLEEVGTVIEDMSPYAIRVLLEAGLGIGLLYRQNGRYFLSKTGHFFLNDSMTRVNTDFMRDVCYDGAKDLESSLEEGKPKGLRHLGPWNTIYEGLSILPEPARKSWFDFDHYYSDQAFPEILPVIFGGDRKPRRVMDIGSNTGKFALACLAYNPEVHLGIVDLQVQLNVATKNLDEAGYGDRYTPIAHNVLDETLELPSGYDTIWMSQFLDCFSDSEIVGILRKCHRALPDEGRVYINETFWDRQRFPASAFALQMTSLYFTTIANGNSQMYDSAVFVELVKEAGFALLQQTDSIGLGHTLLVLQKA